MKLKSLTAAILLGVAGVAAHADTTTLNLTNGETVATGAYHAAGSSFSDTYNLNFSGLAYEGSFATTSISSPGILSFSTLSMTLEELAAGSSTWVSTVYTTLTNGMLSTGKISLTPGAAYKLVVSGTTNGSLGGTYGLSVTTFTTAVPAPVPEPASIALFVAGIGALALVGRRRKMIEKAHADAMMA